MAAATSPSDAFNDRKPLQLDTGALIIEVLQVTSSQPASSPRPPRHLRRVAAEHRARPDRQAPGDQACGRVRIPKSAGVTGSPRSISYPGAPHGSTNGNHTAAATPGPPRPAPWAIFTPRDHSPDVQACGIFVGHAVGLAVSRSWSFRVLGLRLPGADPRLSPRGWPAVDCPGLSSWLDLLGRGRSPGKAARRRLGPVLAWPGPVLSGVGHDAVVGAAGAGASGAGAVAAEHLRGGVRCTSAMRHLRTPPDAGPGVDLKAARTSG